jgi:hypothetical protein
MVCKDQGHTMPISVLTSDILGLNSRRNTGLKAMWTCLFIYLFTYLFIYLVVLGFEVKPSHLLDRQSAYYLSRTSSPFCSDYFGDRVSLFCTAWPRPHFSHFTFPTITGMMGTLPLRWDLVNFFSLTGLEAWPSHLSLPSSWELQMWAIPNYYASLVCHTTFLLALKIILLDKIVNWKIPFYCYNFHCCRLIMLKMFRICFFLFHLLIFSEYF